MLSGLNLNKDRLPCQQITRGPQICSASPLAMFSNTVDSQKWSFPFKICSLKYDSLSTISETINQDPIILNKFFERQNKDS